jgi:hypothetical protein
VASYTTFIKVFNSIFKWGVLGSGAMSLEWQKSMTPYVVLGAIDARGCVDPSILNPVPFIYLSEYKQTRKTRAPLGGGEEKYFFRKSKGKVFLVKHHLHAPPDVGLHAENRLKMKAARAAWRALSQFEKESWTMNKYARAHCLPGYQTFIHFFMKDLL